MEAEARWDEIEAAEPQLRADAEARAVKEVLKRFDSLRPLARFTGFTYPSDELGYDAQGRLVLDRFGESADYTTYGEGWAETYGFGYAYGRVVLSRVDRWTFAADGRPAALDQCFFRDEQGRHRYGGDRYEYDDRGRVVAIDRRWPSDQPQRLVATYDDDTSRPAVVHSDGHVIWRRPVKGMKQIVARVEDALVQSLLAWARAQRPAEPVAAFIVGWSVAFPLIPSVVLATEEERGIWNTAELDTDHVELPDSEDVQHVRQAWQDDDRPPGRMYARIARRLAAEDYSAWPLAEDFVVAAVDMETCDERALARQLRASVSAKRVADFKRRGWLEL